MAKSQSTDDQGTSPAPRRRLSPDERKDQITCAAVELFSETGFDGSTRDVAQRAGITQPLLYRYFPNKDSLIEAVYAKVFLDTWNPEWEGDLSDRTRSVKDRFQTFYEAYAETLFDPVRLRISSFAALRDARFHDWYNHVIQEMILKPLVRERRLELGGADSFLVTPQELEAPWLMHGALLDYGSRRFILGTDVSADTAATISQALDMYLLLTEAQNKA
ncbi:TetR/AcrR family transcriptional regulator [Alphaproteobacteria bacterium KMM 3653]|uniref:TetR/AcrR family transcriptional regulator n=1 Tax=Harenicola maris TaxID=2841044 RepID=A0AAP2G7V1_9RHOB|nr:TetR/AcrR family transcriptional regulator [Harenicola maris]